LTRRPDGEEKATISAWKQGPKQAKEDSVIWRHKKRRGGKNKVVHLNKEKTRGIGIEKRITKKGESAYCKEKRGERGGGNGNL